MRRAAFTALLLAVPLAGLFLLLGVPDLDVAWEHQPSHFWLVLASALLSFLLGFLMAEAAARRGDARVLLVALAFLAASGFLGAARARHARRPPGREERRLPDRLGDRAPHRLGLRGALRPAPRRRLGARGPARAPAPARLGRRRARRLGGGRARDAAAARRADHPRGSARAAPRPLGGRDAALRLRRLPLRAPVRAAPGARRAGRRLRLGAPRRGHARRRHLAGTGT